MGAHARLSPSGTHKWMTCVAAPALEDGCPDTSSKFADEGTALHALSEMALVEDKRAEAFIGRKITAGTRTFEVDEEFAEAAQFYIDYVTELRDRFTVAEVHVEKWLPASDLYCFGKSDDPNVPEEGSGTADFLMIALAALNNPERPSVLHVVDLKGGRGVQVYASDNPQGLMYLCNAMSELDTFEDIDEFHFHIVQPRIQGGFIDSAEYTRAELLEFAAEAAARGNEALQLVAEKQQIFGLAPLGLESDNYDSVEGANFFTKLTDLARPSEKACKFCKAKARCPALEREVIDTVMVDFDDWGPVTEENIKSVPSLNITLNGQMRAIGLIEDWCTAIRAEMELRLLNGAEFPDFKLVEGRKGPRKWIDAKIAEAAMKKARFKTTEMYNFVVRSPPQLEDHVAKKNPRKWAKMKALITQAEGKPSVAPMSDKRPKWTPVKQTDFGPIVEDDDIDLFA
jgi:hypothetical protein